MSDNSFFRPLFLQLALKRMNWLVMDCQDYCCCIFVSCAVDCVVVVM